MRAARRLRLDGLDDFRMAVTEEERAVAHPVVDVLVPIDITLLRPLRRLDVDGKRRQVTDVVRDAAGNGATRTLEERGGFRMAGTVRLDDRHE